MKHVSRVVFGFSIVAVLALFTACQQPAGTSSSPASKPDLGVTPKALLGMINLSSGSNIDVDSNTNVVTFEKDYTSSVSINKEYTVGTAKYTVTDVKSSDNSVVEVKKGTDGKFTVTPKSVKDKGGKAKDVTLTVTVQGKTKDGKDAVSHVKLTIRNSVGVEKVAFTKDALNQLFDNNKAAFEKAVVDALKKNNETKAAVTKDFTIVAPNAPQFTGVTFKWSAGSGSAIAFTNNTAKVTQQATEAKVDISVTLKADGKESDSKKVIAVIVPKKASSQPPATELALNDGDIQTALATAITSGVDFQKNPVEVSADVTIPKTLTIGSESGVTVAVAVEKGNEAGVAAVGVAISDEGTNTKLTVSTASSNAEDNNWKVIFTFSKDGKTKQFAVKAVNKKA